MLCCYCNKEFLGKSWNSKYCSNSCKTIVASRKYYSKNKDIVLSKKKDFYNNNRSTIIQRNSQYCNKRIKTDIDYKIKRYLRSRLYNAVRKGYKSGSAVNDLGCSITEFKNYIGSLFTDGMSWDNYGKWHIDHKIALTKFDLSDKGQLKEACHYTNLQPLWATDNISKSNR